MANTVINKKVCLIGDFAVGKTSLVRRFIYELFDDRYLSTIGVKVSRKVIVLPHQGQQVELALILWDLAGSEEFDRLRASYVRGAAGVVLICDLTRPDTFHHLLSYWDFLQVACPAAQVVLAANKVDLVDEHRLPLAEIASYAAGLRVPYYLTSAKTGEQVEDVFRELGRLVLARQIQA